MTTSIVFGSTPVSVSRASAARTDRSLTCSSAAAMCFPRSPNLSTITCSGIPEQVIVDKFGLRGKHIAAADEHVSDLSVRAAEALLTETGVDPKTIDVVMYYGSTYKDYPVWQVAPNIAY